MKCSVLALISSRCVRLQLSLVREDVVSRTRQADVGSMSASDLHIYLGRVLVLFPRHEVKWANPLNLSI